MGKLNRKLFCKFYKNLSPERQEKVQHNILKAKSAINNVTSEKRENHDVKLYDVYLSYSRRDSVSVIAFCDILKSKGVSVFFDGYDLQPGESFSAVISKAISECKIFVPVITENSLKSDEFFNELCKADEQAKRRAKIICPVLLTGELSELNHSPVGDILMQYQILKARDASEMKMAADSIAYILSSNSDGRLLFDKYSEYKRAGLENEAARVLFDIIHMHCEKMSKGVTDDDAMKLFSYTEELARICYFDYSDEGAKLAMNASNTMGEIISVAEKDLLAKNLLQVSVAIRIMGIVFEIDRVTLDIITGGMVSNGFDMSQPFNNYKSLQERYAVLYNEMKKGDLSCYDERQLAFINETTGYYHGNINVIKGKVEKAPEKEEDNLYKTVARFMNEGNKVLDMIGSEKPARDFIKCLITSYERLKAYSEIVGAKDICAECIEKIAELKQKLMKVTEESVADEIAENGIKSLLGLSIPKSGEYDVFISHKREDYDLALDMYDFLKENFKEGFFDKYSLPEMSNSEYRDAIMQALDGSKHFVVVFSSLDYLNSEWVKLEMKIFRSEIDEGRKDGNFIMVVTNDVYDEIMKSKKAVLPIEYRRCEIIKVEDYKKVLLSYIN